MGLLLHELGTIHFRLAFKFNTDADTLANLIEAEKHLEDCIKLKQSCYEDHHHFIAISRRKLARIKLALFRRDSVTYADRLAQADILSGQAFDVFDALSPTQKKRSIELAHCLLLRAEFYQLSGDPRREDAVSLARSKYVNKFGMAHDKLSNFDHYARQVGLISAE